MRTMITTPDGHKARLHVSLHPEGEGTSVEVRYGTLTVVKRSNTAGDITRKRSAR